jgi:hypothetical protein
MADFPNIRTSDWNQFSETLRRGQLKTKFESGHVHSRARETRARWQFQIGWNWMTRTDYDTLALFFEGHIGGKFNWTHIVTGAVYEVRFSEDVLPEAEPIGLNHVKLTGLPLEQV